MVYYTIIRMNIILHRINTLAKLSGVWHKAQTVELDVTEIGGQFAVAHNKDYHMDLAALEAISLKEAQAMDNRIPLFVNYLTRAVEAGTGLFIEAKGSTDAVASRVAEAIVMAVAAAKERGSIQEDENGLVPTIILHSFSIPALKHAKHIMKSLNTRFPVGLGWTSSIAHAKETASTTLVITEVARMRGCAAVQIERMTPEEWAMAAINICSANNFDIVCVHKSVVTRELVNAAHDAHLRVDSFVITDKNEIGQLLQMGVDSLTCEPNIYE